ncbi:basic proline-rich protein-like [Phalacrocorax carbo]|uniref:basic proline-rich protein-like n=1 Tax=Phalacrocorax carbo TaxID=9209 RepID=UPI00311A1259
MTRSLMDPIRLVKQSGIPTTLSTDPLRERRWSSSETGQLRSRLCQDRATPLPRCPGRGPAAAAGAGGRKPHAQPLSADRHLTPPTPSWQKGPPNGASQGDVRERDTRGRRGRGGGAGGDPQRPGPPRRPASPQRHLRRGEKGPSPNGPRAPPGRRSTRAPVFPRAPPSPPRGTDAVAGAAPYLLLPPLLPAPRLLPPPDPHRTPLPAHTGHAARGAPEPLTEPGGVRWSLAGCAFSRSLSSPRSPSRSARRWVRSAPRPPDGAGRGEAEGGAGRGGGRGGTPTHTLSPSPATRKPHLSRRLRLPLAPPARPRGNANSALATRAVAQPKHQAPPHGVPTASFSPQPVPAPTAAGTAGGDLLGVAGRPGARLRVCGRQRATGGAGGRRDGRGGQRVLTRHRAGERGLPPRSLRRIGPPPPRRCRARPDPSGAPRQSGARAARQHGPCPARPPAHPARSRPWTTPPGPASQPRHPPGRPPLSRRRYRGPAPHRPAPGSRAPLAPSPGGDRGPCATPRRGPALPRPRAARHPPGLAAGSGPLGAPPPRSAARSHL